MKLKMFLLPFLLLCLLCVSCTTNKEDRDSIAVGWIGPLTGEAASYGIAIKNGTELAITEINGLGGVNGRKLKIVYEDDKADPKTGISAMNKLISVDKPPVIIQAAASSVMLANIPIAEKNKIVYISPSCSNDRIKDGGDYIFRIWPSDSYQGVFIARYMFKTMKLTKAAVIYISNDFGVGLKNAFVSEFTRLGGKIVAEESFAQEATDMRTQLSKIKKANPEIVFVPSHIKETIKVLRQSKELALTMPFFADAASFSPDLLSSTHRAVDNLYIVNLDWDTNSPDPKTVSFISSYKKAFNADPDIYSAAGFDVVYVIAEAMKMSNDITSESIKKGLYSIKNFHGVTGRIAFDAYGEVEKEYSVYKVIGGKFMKLR